METYHFLNELDVSYLHVFTYSERENTLAASCLVVRAWSQEVAKAYGKYDQRRESGGGYKPIEARVDPVWNKGMAPKTFAF